MAQRTPAGYRKIKMPDGSTRFRKSAKSSSSSSGAGRKRTVSAAGRAAMSAARKGKPHPHKGVSPSAATRAKIAASLRARG